MQCMQLSSFYICTDTYITSRLNQHISNNDEIRTLYGRLLLMVLRPCSCSCNHSNCALLNPDYTAHMAPAENEDLVLYSLYNWWILYVYSLSLSTLQKTIDRSKKMHFY